MAEDWVRVMLLLINSMAAKPIPTATAIVISNRTVKVKHKSRTTTSSLGAILMDRMKCFASLIFQATISNNAAIDAMGMYDRTGERSNILISMNKAWTTEARGRLPPDLTFAAVRAMAAVAGMPPNNGAMMLPMP